MMNSVTVKIFKHLCIASYIQLPIKPFVLITCMYRTLPSRSTHNMTT